MKTTKTRVATMTTTKQTNHDTPGNGLSDNSTSHQTIFDEIAAKATDSEKHSKKTKEDIVSWILNKRKTLCCSITSLHKKKDVSVVLDPLIKEFESHIFPHLIDDDDKDDYDYCANDDNDKNGVTPLMLACDKSNQPVLIYLQNYAEILFSSLSSSPNKDNSTNRKKKKMKLLFYWIQLIGHPLQKSDVTQGQNSAVHYAATANFGHGVDTLTSMIQLIYSVQENEKQQRRYYEIYLELLTIQNSNNDTPIMMACAGGCIEALQHWISILSLHSSIFETMASSRGYDDSVEDYNDLQQQIHNAFGMKNLTGDSAFLLSCGHGHFNVVHLLISPHTITLQPEKGEKSATEKYITMMTITYAHIQQCRSILKQIDDALAPALLHQKQAEQTLQKTITVNGQNKTRKELMMEFQQNRKNVYKCLVLLQNRLDEAARQKMNELLMEEEGEEEIQSSSSQSKNKHKKKKKKKQKIKKQHQQYTLKEGTESLLLNKSKNNGDAHEGGTNEEEEDSNNKEKDHTKRSSPTKQVEANANIAKNKNGDDIHIDDETHITRSSADTKITSSRKVMNTMTTTSEIISPFITLADGSVVTSSKVVKDSTNPTSNSALLFAEKEEEPTLSSLDKMLRECCHHHQIAQFEHCVVADGDNKKYFDAKKNDSNEKISKQEKNILRASPSSSSSLLTMNAEAEAVMDSLCLDASMLLYSPHGMAMNLSPCQLDAVEDLLRTQLKAVEDGKRIQKRVLNISARQKEAKEDTMKKVGNGI